MTRFCDFLTWRDGKRLVALDKLLQYHHSTLLHTAKDPKKGRYTLIMRASLVDIS